MLDLVVSGKECTKCKNRRALSEFGRAKHHSDGLKSHCKTCEKSWHAANYKNGPKVKDRNAAWAKANPDKRMTWQRKDQRDNPEKYRDWRLKRAFGITLGQYNRMFADQNGCCAICQRHQSEFKQALCVDHNHATGKIRKLLCAQCNHALGLLREDIETVKRLAAYIKAHRN